MWVGPRWGTYDGRRVLELWGLSGRYVFGRGWDRAVPVVWRIFSCSRCGRVPCVRDGVVA